MTTGLRMYRTNKEAWLKFQSCLFIICRDDYLY